MWKIFETISINYSQPMFDKKSLLRAKALPSHDGEIRYKKHPLERQFLAVAS